MNVTQYLFRPLHFTQVPLLRALSDYVLQVTPAKAATLTSDKHKGTVCAQVL